MQTIQGRKLVRKLYEEIRDLLYALCILRNKKLYSFLFENLIKNSIKVLKVSFFFTHPNLAQATTHSMLRQYLNKKSKITNQQNYIFQISKNIFWIHNQHSLKSCEFRITTFF